MENRKYFEVRISCTGYIQVGVYADTPEEATKKVKDYCDNERINPALIHITSLEVPNAQEETDCSCDCSRGININTQKFDVGDIVKIVKGYIADKSDTTYIGCTGKILYTYADDTIYVQVYPCGLCFWFDDAVELIEGRIKDAED